jgi:predicted dehydrogenase
VLGCGTIAYWTHLRILKRLRGATLVAAADPDPQARARAERLVGVPIYARPEDLLARDDIDAVVICAPTGVHAGLVVATCAASRHVYVEKPIAATAEDARRMVEAAERARVSAVVGFNRRLHPVYQAARAIVAGGRLGRVHAVQTAFCEPAPPDGMQDWKRQRSTGGGVLLELASHHIDLLRWFLSDEVAVVEARVVSRSSEQDTATLRLGMRGGTETSSLFTFRAALADHLEFFGERGTLRVDRHRSTLDWRVGRWLGYGIRRRWVVPRPEDIAWRLYRFVRPSQDPSYRRSLAAFVAMLNGESPPLARLTDGVRALEVVLAAEQSAREGQPRPVGE